MQIVCLTIAPAFLAAGIYLTLSRIVITFGPENSHIKPLSYPRIFIPCDVISLLLQAIGGGMASVASHQDKSPDTGDHIMVAGLAFQVLTLLMFQLLCLDFLIKTLRRMRSMGEAALDPEHAALRHSAKFRVFLVALALATVCIFIRSVYRVAELSEGWTGALIQNQRLFIVLEGAMVIAAVSVLNAFHPGYCFREGYKQRKYKNLFRKKAKRPADVGDEKGSPVRDESSGAATPVVRDVEGNAPDVKDGPGDVSKEEKQDAAKEKEPVEVGVNEAATPAPDAAQNITDMKEERQEAAATPVPVITETAADIKDEQRGHAGT